MIGVGHVQDDVAAAAIEVPAKRDAQVIHLAVALLENRVRPVELHALEVSLHDEVNNARHGVGAVYGRRATRDHLHALNETRRNHVDIDQSVILVGRQALTVHQDQGALLAEVTQVQGGHAGITVIGVLAKRCGELRHAAQVLFYIDRIQRAEVVRLDHRDGAAARQVRPGDA